MAWSTPPTWADTPSGPHSATDFNTLVYDIVALSGAASEINIPFSSWALKSGDNDDTNNLWTVRHTHRYLHYALEILAGDLAEIDIWYDGVQIWSDGTNRSGPYTWTGYIDLEDTGILATTPTVGDFYPIYVETEQDGGSTLDVFVAYLIEHPETSL